MRFNVGDLVRLYRDDARYIYSYNCVPKEMLNDLFLITEVTSDQVHILHPPTGTPVLCYKSEIKVVHTR
jgi:hypothetical protein